MVGGGQQGQRSEPPPRMPIPALLVWALHIGKRRPRSAHSVRIGGFWRKPQRTLSRPTTSTRLATTAMGNWFVAVIVAVTLVGPAFSEGHVETDANLLTAIDESASVGRHGEWLQYNGLARALESPEFLDAIRRSGDKGRIGFSVVAWSSHGNVRVVLPWMVVGSEADAERAANIIDHASRVDRSPWEDEDETGASRPTDDAGTYTDISATISAAGRLVEAAPFESERGVVNILANGRDNVGDGPSSATRQSVSLGLTVNGVVFGSDRGLADYFRQHVIGGAGSFVESVDANPHTFNAMMVRKFVRDLLW